MDALEELKKLGQMKSVLFVDDNQKLREILTKFLSKFFKSVIVAKDGEEGFTLFKVTKPDIIMTDIQMPQVSGLEMIRRIREENYDISVIVMSAFDEKQYLLDSIKYGVVNYIKKPVPISVLTQALIEILTKLKNQEEREIFKKYTNDSFNYQSSIIMLFENQQMKIVNPAFLDFFQVESLNQFKKEHEEVGDLFVQKEGFLYNSVDKKWIEKIVQKNGHHFHVAIDDKESNIHHFLAKYDLISDQEWYGVFILDDITSLNLLSLFEQSEAYDEKFFGDIATITNAINLLIKQHIEVKIYNHYKGLSITNVAKIVYADNDVVTFQTNSHQLSASQYEKHVIISSETIPNFIWCDEIVSIDCQKQLITVSKLKFMRKNLVQRENIRFIPEPDSKISLIFKLKEFLGNVSIIDISAEGIKLKVNSLLVGMRDGETIEAILTLARSSEKIELNIKSKIFRIEKHDTFLYLVLYFESDEETNRILTAYISKRQKQLIREFKALKCI